MQQLAGHLREQKTSQEAWTGTSTTACLKSRIFRNFPPVAWVVLWRSDRHEQTRTGQLLAPGRVP
jgi:hypothetical protein